LYSSDDLGVAGDGDRIASRIGKVVSMHKGMAKKRDENEGVRVPHGSSVVSICCSIVKSDKKKNVRQALWHRSSLRSERGPDSDAHLTMVMSP
jgi:hypothetical protein